MSNLYTVGTYLRSTDPASDILWEIIEVYQFSGYYLIYRCKAYELGPITMILGTEVDDGKYVVYDWGYRELIQEIANDSPII